LARSLNNAKVQAMNDKAQSNLQKNINDFLVI